MGQLTDLLPVMLVALILWLLALSLVFYKILGHYRKFARKAHEGDLISALEALRKLEEENTKSVRLLQSEIAFLKENALLPLQKVGLVRFNSFGETGGNQSFSLCLLNGKNDGCVMTALHTRDRTRVYTKSIVSGESKYELSSEEAKALKEAQK